KEGSRLVIGLEGELVNIRESTAEMGVKRMASLIEYTTAWGVSHGVHFNDRWNFWGGEMSYFCPNCQSILKYWRRFSEK
ncbi:hypothetical protein GHI33_10230, partial [Glaesserella parasuis]|nr:hypothetical protein [Glaesserella parasuis]